jgi:hypothetical protein
MTIEIIRKWVCCNRESCNMRYGDGTCITLDGDPGQYTDEQWMQLALTYYNSRPVEPDPMQMILLSCSDVELVNECIRRHLTVIVGQMGE